MRRVRTSLIVAASVVVLIAAAGCGVTADTTAATVAGRTVSVDTVNDLARDAAFVGDSSGEESESVLPGTLARGVLTFEIQRTAWIAEAKRFGVGVGDSARAEARQQIEEDPASSELRGRTVDLMVDYLAAQTLLSERFESIDPDSEADLRRMYDAVPDNWDRVCVGGLAVPVEERDIVDGLLEDGTAVEDVPEQVADAQVFSSESTGCLPLAAFPKDLRDAAAATPTGELSVGVVVTGASGDAVYYLRIDERLTLPFEEAREELVELLTQGVDAWIQLLVANAQVNPRYGSGMEQGADGRYSVAAPPAPQLPAGWPTMAAGSGGVTDTGQ